MLTVLVLPMLAITVSAVIAKRLRILAILALVAFLPVVAGLVAYLNAPPEQPHLQGENMIGLVLAALMSLYPLFVITARACSL